MPFLVAALLGISLVVMLWPTGPLTAPETDQWSHLRTAISPGRIPGTLRRAPFWARLIPTGVEIALRRMRSARLQGPDLLDRRLRYAQLQDLISAEQFICLRFLVPAALFCGLLASYLFDPAPWRLVLTLAGIGVGVAVPDHWLKQQVRQNQERIKHELPSILTTLGVLLDSGLNLVPALEEVIDQKQGLLSAILRGALQQAALGTPIQEALQEAADGTGVQELILFVSVLGQSMTKGSYSISETVRGQSRQMWSLRQQQVQEKGQEMSQDLFMVLLLFGFPAIVLFLLGPVGLSLYHTFFR